MKDLGKFPVALSLEIPCGAILYLMKSGGVRKITLTFYSFEERIQFDLCNEIV